MEFGAWDGMTFVEVAEQHADDLEAWLGSIDAVPGGTGESFRHVEERVLAALGRVLEEHAGRTVVVVSHVTPIKTLVAHTLDAPLLSVFRMELTPASVTRALVLRRATTARARRCASTTPSRPACRPFGDPDRW